MDYIRPDRRLLYVWQLRTAAVSLVPAVGVSLFFPPPSALWLGLSALWVIGFGAMLAIYLPMRHASTSYRVDDRAVEINRGVFYLTSQSVLLRNLEYVTLQSAPDERLIGLCSVSLFVVGGRARLCGLSADTARRLLARLPLPAEETAP
jgi:membrane protein YdbS with pleckstrin-like domain